MKSKTLNGSFKLPLFASIVAAAFMAICSGQTRANTVALSFSDGSHTTGTSTGGYTLGWAFTLSGPIVLTDLGLWDGPVGSGDGFAEDHIVTIWENTSQLVVAQVTIPAGMSGTLLNDFRYLSVAPTLLATGSYTIGAFYSESSLDGFITGSSTVTTAAGITYDGGRFLGAGGGFPPTDIFQGVLDDGFFGPNFQFTLPDGNGTTVPESSATWMLMLLGLTATSGIHLLLRRQSLPLISDI